MYKIIVVAFVFAIFGSICSAEMFTSVEAFRDVFDAKRSLADELEHFLVAENDRIAKIERMISDAEKHVSIPDDELEDFLANPVNIFALIKNLRRENFTELLNAIMPNALIVEETVKKAQPLTARLPTAEDAVGSTFAIFRLQDTYKLSPADFADGRLPGLIQAGSSTTRLTAKDCFDIGAVAYWQDDHEHSVAWMEETLQRLPNEPRSQLELSRAVILGYTSFSNFKIGNIATAVEQTEELIALDPNNPQARTNRDYFIEMLEPEDQRRHIQTMASGPQ